MSAGRLADETPEYRRLRDELLEAEIALKDQREAVAELRRRLPRDNPVDPGYLFHEGPRDLAAGDAPIVERKLEELFDDPQKPLVLLHFMYGKKQEQPCPMCTLWADGYERIVPHLEQRMNFAVVVAGEIGRFRAYARERGWRRLRLLSSGASSLKRDLGLEGEDGSQQPGVSVFTLGADGRARHFYSGGAIMAEGQYRGMDLLSPLWNFLDLTPEGRGDFMPQLGYGG